MSFPISGPEFLVLLLVLTIIIGPSRLPDVARSITKWIKAARMQLAKLKAELNENSELGLSDIDLSALDPRKYDPRRLVKEAVQEEMDEWKDLLSPFGTTKANSENADSSGAETMRDSIIGVAEEAAHKAVEEASAQAVAEALEAAGIVAPAEKETEGKVGRTLSSKGRGKKNEMPRYGGIYRIQPVVRPAAGPSRRALSKRLKHNKPKGRN
ncbi:twin-arginine translocase TatA/TatE family subunit [Gleimia sp. 6138-11-ORH1]|uniref:twin-arginine translocase TatA/TatE family subunit n=1 Tax=Gleimia sp. 6138-11-ORH1 TaxID=2973937 RepID=UPI0021692B5E|nr:twin-arginine translocase TatA/TatE family subunit [Gleimia sp. 6138-11-ORH1]MCS4483966.1 twin-arginine translocase TatA/TatE family subunit [Gleimia sp. 6138-11-ORH1]